MNGLILVVAAIVVVVGVAIWLVRRSSPRDPASNSPAPAAGVAVAELSRPALPAEGLLVSEDVLRSAGSSPDAIWDALEAAAVPIALEYYPVSDAELAKYRTVPINASAQQALVRIVEAINPKSPTLFRAVLPKGAELVKAVGADGFRGFSRTGGQTAHAVLKPVAAGGAIAAGWPVLAVAGTVMAVDMVAQREQRAHQRRVEASLGRQEERYYVERITNQRSADAQLSRAISLMLDGRNPQVELAVKSADDEFHRSQQFLDKYRNIVAPLVGAGEVDYRRLEEALGGKTKEIDHFVRELHLARAALAIKRKALVTDAAAAALADPGNEYVALRRLLDTQVHQLELAEAGLGELSEGLAAAQLKGRWHDRDKQVAARQRALRAKVSAPVDGHNDEVVFLLTSSGELLQALPTGGDDPEPVLPDEDSDDAAVDQTSTPDRGDDLHS
jgi:hypothetical protein